MSSHDDDLPELETSVIEPIDESKFTAPVGGGRPGGAPSSASGSFPHPGAPPSAGQSGQFNAPRPPPPAAARSGQVPQPSAASGQFPSAGPSQQPSGQFPNARPPQQSGQFPTGAPSQSGQFPAGGARFHTGANAAPSAYPQGQQLTEMSGRFPMPPQSTPPPPSSGPQPRVQAQAPPPGGAGDFAEAVTSFHKMETEAKPPSGVKRGAISVTSAVIVGVFAALVTAYLAITRWISPVEAMVWMGVGTLLPSLFTGLLVIMPNRDKLTPKLFVAGMAPAFAVTAAAIVFGGLWASGDIRASAVGLVPSEKAVVEKVLRDPAPEVAVAACKKLAVFHEDPQWRPLLMSVMTLRPSMAVTCLRDLDPAAQLSLAPSLADRWTRQLDAEHAAAESKEDVCSAAGAMAQLPLEQGELDARLMYCALGAPTAEAQECCGTALAATVSDPMQWVSHIRDAIGFIRDDDTAMGVFALAFHQKNLSPAQKRFADSVTFKGRDAQKVALEFACDHITNGKTQVINHIDAALEGKCAIDSGNLPQARPLWTDICYDTLIELDMRPKAETTDVLCEVTRRTLFESAAQNAHSLIRLAATKDMQDNVAGKINLGYSKLVNDIAYRPANAEGEGWINQNDIDSARFDSTRKYMEATAGQDRPDIPAPAYLWDGDKNKIVKNPEAGEMPKKKKR